MLNLNSAIPFSSDFSDATPVITAYLSRNGNYSAPYPEPNVGSE